MDCPLKETDTTLPLQAETTASVANCNRWQADPLVFNVTFVEPGLFAPARCATVSTLCELVVELSPMTAP